MPSGGWEENNAQGSVEIKNAQCCKESTLNMPVVVDREMGQFR